MGVENDLATYVSENETVNAPVTGVTQNHITETEKPSVSRYDRIKSELDKLGYQKIDVKTLPTGGLFYPEDVDIKVRAANGGEIKHWSTMSDEDISSIDGIIDYVIEKCLLIKGGNGMNWRDIKEIDRFYLLLCIREFTFPDGENNLLVPISEGKEIPMMKEMIDYIDIPSNIMEHYSAEERCFSFKLKNNSVIKMYIPSIGVKMWLSNYVRTKEESQQGYDRDFIKYAQMLIPDYRNLTTKTYEDLVLSTQSYGVKEWSLIAYVIDTLTKTLRPELKYNKEDGTEQRVPMTFLGGIKAVFSISDPISILC